MTTQTFKPSVKRPFPVTLLAILAGIAAFLAGIHALQGLGVLPYFIGSVKLHSFNLWNFLMWGLMVWVYVWLVQMLWKVDPQAWFFLAVITTFNLILDFVAMLGSSTSFSDVSVSFIVNAIILIYCMLPGTKRAFGVAR
ncbi:MAG: hypothetical protein ACM30E_00215 [Nitrososphaerales archaeon]